MEDHGARNAHDGVLEVEGEIEEELRKEHAYAKIHDQFDGLSSHRTKEDEGDHSGNTSEHGEGEQYVHYVVQGSVEACIRATTT